MSSGNNDLSFVYSELMAKGITLRYDLKYCFKKNDKSEVFEGVNKLEYCDLRNSNLTVHQVFT